MAIYGPKMKLEMQVIKIVAGKKHNFLPKQILIVQWEQIIICHGLRQLDVFGKREPLICCKSGRIQKKKRSFRSSEKYQAVFEEIVTTSTLPHLTAFVQMMWELMWPRRIHGTVVMV